MKPLYSVAISVVALASSAGAAGQTLGKGGTMVNEAMTVPKCEAPLGTVALVEANKQVNASGQLPPGVEAMMSLARAQQGLSTARAEPLPLLKMIMAASGCFQIVDRGTGFDALQRERALASGGQVSGAPAGATITPADYLLTAEVVYQDENAGSRGGVLGGLGGLGGGLMGLAGGLKQKKLESQTMLTLVAVKTGVQEAVATGSARKRDLKFLAGGLAGLGAGLLGGDQSTDISKVTAAALLDAFAKLVPQAQASRARLAAAAPPAAPASAATAAIVPASAPVRP